jgi:hypothetical protein
MSKIALLVIVVSLLAVVVVLVGAYFARRVKQGLEQPTGPQIGARAEFRLSPERISQLRALTAQPILMKQSEEGVRVQIEDRPMVPLAVFLGQEVTAALGEAAAGVSQTFGASWVALVTPRDDGRVSVDRLA